MRHVFDRSFVMVTFAAMAAVANGCGNSSSGGSPDSGPSTTATSSTTSASTTPTSTSSTSKSSTSSTEAGPPTPIVSCNFDANAECTLPSTGSWILNNYHDPSGNNLDYVPTVDGGTDAGDASSDAMADSGEGGAGEGGAGGGLPTLTVNTTDGMPSPGSLQLTATFTSLGQYVEAILPLAALDLSTATVSLQVRLASITGAASFPGGAQLYASTAGATYCYTADPIVATLTPGTWTTMSENLTTAQGSGCTADPSDVRIIGVHFYTMAGTDGGALAGPFTATFEIDTVLAE